MSVDSRTIEEKDTIEVIEENEELFETIHEQADDPTVAEQYGRQPLRLLELARKRGDQA